MFPNTNHKRRCQVDTNFEQTINKDSSRNWWIDGFSSAELWATVASLVL